MARHKPFEIPSGRATLLKVAMSRQERETRQRDLPAEYIDAIALMQLQRGICKCGCGQPMDLEIARDAESPPDDYPVVAHEFYRAGKNAPGHLIGEVWWWRNICNRREAASENVARGVANKLAIDLLKKEPKPDADDEPKTRKSSWGNSKGVSKLSRDHPGYRKQQWGKRKVKAR